MIFSEAFELVFEFGEMATLTELDRGLTQTPRDSKHCLASFSFSAEVLDIARTLSNDTERNVFFSPFSAIVGKIPLSIQLRRKRVVLMECLH
jgi:hypothetical protein